MALVVEPEGVKCNLPAAPQKPVQRDDAEPETLPAAVRTATDATRILLIHPSRLLRDCLKQALDSDLEHEIAGFDSIEDAEDLISDDGTVLLVVAMSAFNRQDLEEPLEHLTTLSAGKPIVVTGDSDDPRLIIELLSNGIRGYLPNSLELGVWIHALRLVMAGGLYAPAESLLKLQDCANTEPPSRAKQFSLTAKQLAVVDALRKGKANKTIAYELNMCESTVKVHVRTIMRKLQAKNRTQVAYIANELLRDYQPESS